MEMKMGISGNRSVVQMIIVLLIFALAVIIGMDSLTQPDVVPADAPETEFSAERAMKHLKVIAQRPHPVGSPANDEVREYIVAQLRSMGLSPEVQKATSVKTLKGRVIASTVYNVLAKIPGANPSKAIALDAHYDSMPTTFGAGDCGSCVVTLLETARALKAGPPLKNDVMLLFTDIEEFGPALGARAFFEEHPWASEIGVVLGFEGIGRTGPSIMFEPGPGSGWLIDELGEVTSRPVAQSWFFDVYKRTPTNTDFNVYAKAGLAGLNFVYLNEGTVYHTRLDNIETIDLRSVQHHGDYALSITRHLGNLDLNNIQNDYSGDSVYFTLFRGWLVNYPASWALPFSIISGLLLIAITVMGIRKKQATLSGTLWGFLSFFLSVVLSAGLTFGIWTAVYGLHDQYHAMFFGRIYNAHLYLFGFMAMAIAVGSTLVILFRKKAKVTDLTLGALILWWILALVTSLMMPGFSYLFTWPMLFAIVSLAWVYWRDQAESASWQRILALTLGVVPAVIIYAPSIDIMFQYAPTSLLAITVFMFALLLGLLIPQIDLLTRVRKWWLPGAAFLVTLGFLAAGSLTADFSLEQPRPNSIAYFQDTDKGESFWFSKAEQPDAWTSQFFPAGKGIKIRKVGEFLPLSLFDRRSVITASAPAVSLAPPDVKILDDQTQGASRRMRLHLTSARSASIITMDVTPRQAIQVITIDEHRIKKPEVSKKKSDYWGLIYYAVPPEGIEVSIEVNAAQPIKLLVTDQSWDLPVIPGMNIRPRPSDMLAMPNFDYGTVVSKSFDIQ